MNPSEINTIAMLEAYMKYTLSLGLVITCLFTNPIVSFATDENLTEQEGMEIRFETLTMEDINLINSLNNEDEIIQPSGPVEGTYYDQLAATLVNSKDNLVLPSRCKNNRTTDCVSWELYNNDSIMEFVKTDLIGNTEIDAEKRTKTLFAIAYHNKSVHNLIIVLLNDFYKDMWVQNARDLREYEETAVNITLGATLAFALVTGNPMPALVTFFAKGMTTRKHLIQEIDDIRFKNPDHFAYGYCPNSYAVKLSDEKIKPICKLTLQEAIEALEEIGIK